MLAGYSQQTKGAWNKWRIVLEVTAGEKSRQECKKKEFKAKFKDIKKLKSYKKAAPETFWKDFPVNRRMKAKGSVSREALLELVKRVGCSDMARLSRVVERIEKGADIGCRGRFRYSSSSKNAPSAYEAGAQVTDAIAEWVEAGYAFGPVEESEVPAAAKISGIMVKMKPNGAARVILNLSAPKGMAVNEGIAADEFPAVMSSTEAWLEVLNRAGRRAWMTKIDWAAAYKQIAVREEDTDLQWFSWAGKFFKELCLIFGSASSAGIFDDLAKIVLDIVIRMAKFERRMVCQHLDDTCAAGAEGSDSVRRFDETFSLVAERLGIKLAPRDDPEKSFGPSQRGIVFGILYDTVEWTWSIPEERRIRLVTAIEAAMSCDELGEREVQSLVGKIVNVKPLVPAGRFNIDHIMAMLRQVSGEGKVGISEACRRQLSFWSLMLRSCVGRLSIPDPREQMPAWALDIFTDAAGGSSEAVGRGSGGVLGEQWFYVQWSDCINKGRWKVDGKKVGRKLTALELIGPLVSLVVFAERCRGWPVNIWVDNAGAVRIWQKGYSSWCRLSTTIVKALSSVASALGCRVEIRKVARCSGTGPKLADQLSKAEFKAFRETGRAAGWPLDVDPSRLQGPLLRWVQRPEPWDDLGHVVLLWLSTRTEVLGYSAAS